MKCYICEGNLYSLGTVPFDRNNEDIPIIDNTQFEYFKCSNCGSILCPEMLSWSPAELGSKVYNEDYIKYDPDFKSVRPVNYADALHQVLWPGIKHIKHLDYGCGEGLMVKLLNEKKWNSTAYDPYYNNIPPQDIFQLITAIEVVEHATDIRKVLTDMKKYLDLRNGVILFSTLLAKPEHTIDWWYIGARNGHINMLSDKAYKIIGKEFGLFFSSLAHNIHLLQTTRNNFKQLNNRSIW